MGRPSRYTPELATEIVDRLSEGETLRQICKSKHMPTEGCVRYWVKQEVHKEFAERYLVAREIGYHMMIDEMLEIAHDKTGDVQRDRLRVDSIKWLAGKTLPKIYGDKVTAELTGKDGGPIETESKTDGDLAKALVGLFQRAGQ